MANTPEVQGFFEPATNSVQYVAWDPETGQAAIIDPVLNFDPNWGRTSSESADEILAFIQDKGLTVQWILDTHPHADHFTAARYLQDKTGAPRAIGEKVLEVQKLWRGYYNFGDDFPVDASRWDRLFADGEPFRLGTIDARVMLSPGHTLASITYVIGDAAFIHDTLFMPDYGTARADFPGGDSRVLWRSIQAILALGDETRLFVGHDYRPGGREAAWEATVAEHKAKNPHLQNMDEESFKRLRDSRDATLTMPRLILFALQVNAWGGVLPPAESNGVSYFKIPANFLQHFMERKEAPALESAAG